MLRAQGMTGGIFAMSRHFWNATGGYDLQMEVRLYLARLFFLFLRRIISIERIVVV